MSMKGMQVGRKVRPLSYCGGPKKVEQYANMTEGELEESKELAEDLKGKEGIDNPHALARWQVQR